ncbi:MAG: PhzF family phenazine biosynthesis protein [Clostridiales bacterium]|jgi:PhzF family phenazine biosynthesis protein|nr:PhzF family phenazine biosynthesis protein [Clostridiales bacterium]
MLYFVVDAFASKKFRGNPAGVCVLPKQLDDGVLQGVAAENNLATTAFITKNGYNYNIRWFTPMCEVNLCGHATLASAYVILNYLDTKSKRVEFHSKSGILKVENKDGVYEMNLPAGDPVKIDRTLEMQRAVNARVNEAYASKSLMLVLENEEAVQNLNPNMDLIASFQDYAGVIVTAKGEEVDFVSRFFCPNNGIGEDYVTGSAHTILTPYWAGVLCKDTLTAKQLSKRGGMLYCENLGSRVKVGGRAQIYLKGEIIL